MKKLAAIAGILAAVGFVGAASAADMPTKAPARVVTPMAYDWSGFYIGGEVGGEWDQTNLSRVAPAPPGTLAYSVSHNSVAVGGFAGVQKQFGQFVLGVEGGYVTGFGNTTFATPSTNIFGPGGTGTGTVKGARDLWSLGGRGGYAINNWLPYVTGGYANGKFGFSAATTGAPTDEFASTNLGGYYIGGGLDYGITQNWIIGAEYRHYGFTSKTVAGVSPLAGETVNIGGKADTFMGRLSYKFGWPR